MSAPVLFATCFTDPTDPARVYERLARVLAYSAAQQCPSWQREIETAPAPPAHRNPSAAWRANAHKMTRWCQRLDQAVDADAILFLDVDTCIVRPLEALWEWPFDLAYTVKTTQRYPFNTGVVAVRVSPAIRSFFRRWHAETVRMLDDRLHHQAWRRQYGGIHQAALGALFSAGAARDLTLAQLPCREWNCEDTNWAAFDPQATRIVHLKDGLRRAVLGLTVGANHRVRAIVTYWRALERQAQAAVA